MAKVERSRSGVALNPRPELKRDKTRREMYKKPNSEKTIEKTIVFPSKTKIKTIVERKYKNGVIKRRLVSVKPVK